MPSGGPRPGSGAPKGNLNALKHGRSSRQLKHASQVLAALPRPPEPVNGVKPRISQRRQAARTVAAHLLASLLERVPSRLQPRDGPPMLKVRKLLEAASDTRASERLARPFPRHRPRKEFHNP